jgi:hypothetical protein
LIAFNNSTESTNFNISGFNNSTESTNFNISGFNNSTESTNFDISGFNNSTESTNFNISGFRFYGDFIVFSIKDLMKTTRPGHSMQKVKTNAFTHEKLCNEILYIKNRTKTSF